MRLKFLTRALALTALAGVTALCIFLYVLAGTTQGSQWLLRYIDGLSNDWSITAENITGSLLYGLTLNRLSFATAETASVDIDTLHFQWHPESLLRGAVKISPLRADGIEVAVKPSGKNEARPTAQTPGNWRLPIGIAVENARLQSIAIETNGSTFHLATVGLEEGSLGRTLQVRQLNLAADTYSFTVPEGKISPAPPYKSELEIAWQLTADGTAAEGRATLSGDLATLNVEHTLTAPVSVESHAVLHSGLLTEEPPHLVLENKISDGLWVYGQDQAVRVPSATLQLRGWLDEYFLQVKGSVVAPNMPEAGVALEGRGDLDGLQIQDLTIRGLGGSVTGTGKLSWQPAVDWNLQLQARNINPGAYWENWPGTIAMQGAIKGEYAADKLYTNLRVESLSGSLRDFPLQASGNVALKNGRWSSPGLQLKLGKNQIQVSGNIGDNTAAAQWNIQAPNLTALWPALNGQLVGRGKLEGTASHLNVAGELRGENLEYENYSAGFVELNATSTSANGVSSNGFKHSIQIQADELNVNGLLVNGLKSEISGSLDNHEIQTALSTPYGELNLKISGHWQAPQWQASLQQASIRDTPTGAWLLQSPSSLLVSSNGLSLSETCWQQDQAEACLAGSIEDNKAGVSANLKDIPLSLAKLWLPPGVEIHGRLNGRLQAAGPLQALTGTLELQPEAGYFRVKQTEGDPEIYNWRNARLNLNFTDGSYTLTAGLELPGQGEASAVVKADPQKHLDGTVNLHFTQLDWLETWIPSLKNIRGAFDAELRLTGSLKQPQWQGDAKLHSAAVSVPILGIELDEVNVTVNGVGKNRLLVKGSAESGPGQISFDGQIEKPSEQPWQLELNLDGNRFEAISTPEAHVLASPDLKLSASRKLVYAEGVIKLPEVNIQLESLPDRTVKVSEDVVIVNEPEAGIEQAGGIPIKTNVKLILGDEVRFTGFGFEAELSGSLELVEEPGQPSLAYGTLTIDEGRYKAYGQNLAVEKGKLIFQGPYDNPALDIRAVRKAQDVTVGLNIGGTLKNIRSTVFSEPALPESEAVAILLTGKPLSGATESDANLLVNAVASLGIKKSEAITSQLSETFGLDVLTIESENGLEQSSLTIGKYLTPRLYVRYAIGLFDQMSKLALEYRLTENIMVEAKSGQAQSMDIIYRIER